MNARSFRSSVVRRLPAWGSTLELEAEPGLQLHRPAAQCPAGHAEVRVWMSNRAIRRYATQIRIDGLGVDVVLEEVVNVGADFKAGALSQASDPGQAEALAKAEIDVVIARAVQAVALDSGSRRRRGGRESCPLNISRRHEKLGAVAAVIRVGGPHECAVAGA